MLADRGAVTALYFRLRALFHLFLLTHLLMSLPPSSHLRVDVAVVAEALQLASRSPLALIDLDKLFLSAGHRVRVLQLQLWQLGLG